MHDRLFDNQSAMTRGDLLALTQALGLDVTRFTATMDAEQTWAIVDRAPGRRAAAPGVREGVDEALAATSAARRPK